jgi:hypothetical protein
MHAGPVESIPPLCCWTPVPTRCGWGFDERTPLDAARESGNDALIRLVEAATTRGAD